MKDIPEPPKPPLSRVIREGVGKLCDNCGSTMSRNGLFGKRSCDNYECVNSEIDSSPNNKPDIIDLFIVLFPIILILIILFCE